MAAKNNFAFLETDLHDDVVVVTLNRPPVNAVSQAMYQEIRDLFARWDEWFPTSSVTILRGSGPNFCAGNDLVEFLSLTPQNSAGRMKLVREAFWAIYDCPVPVIAAVHGYAVGTGLALAAVCDLVLCADSAQLGVPEVRVGVMGGAKHLSRLVPDHMVRLMYLTADPLPASALLPYGGIVEIVPEAQLLDSALTLASRISRHSKVAVRTAKQSLNMVEHMDLKAGYEAEQALTARLSGSVDSLEARQAMVEKRQPRFQSNIF